MSITPICTTKELGLVTWNDPLPTTSNGTTGLNMDPNICLIDEYNYNKELLPFLGSLNYGTWEEEIYDCDDQALWGLAHLRHAYPGAPAGIASGETVAGERHALIIMWYRYKGEIRQAFYDPRHKDLVDFGEINSIVAFPPSGKPENTPPITKSLDGNMLVYDEKRLVYPKDAIISYLKNREYEDQCDDAKHHTPKDDEYFDSYWLKSPPDRALWAFVHVRRNFPGSPVGVAKGTKAGSKWTSWAVIVYYKEDDDENKQIKHTYFDPHPKTPSEIAPDQFTPKMIFI